MNENLPLIYLFGGLLAVLLIGVFLIAAVIATMDFQKELKHLNLEIGRTSGREQRYWQRRKKRLLLSLIPFVRYKD